jgi:hypothetical protein
MRASRIWRDNGQQRASLRQGGEIHFPGWEWRGAARFIDP